MTVNKTLSKNGIKAICEYSQRAKSKYGESLYSSCVKDFDDVKIYGVVETKDGKKHRMTIKW